MFLNFIFLAGTQSLLDGVAQQNNFLAGVDLPAAVLLQAATNAAKSGNVINGSYSF